MISDTIERILGSSLVYAGIARGFVFVAVAVMVWALGDRLARSAIGSRRRRCPGCKYSLDGLEVRDSHFLCPECGKRSTPRRTGFLERLEWRPRWRAFAAGVLMLAGASASWWWFARPTPIPAGTQQQAAQPQVMINTFISPGSPPPSN